MDNEFDKINEETAQAEVTEKDDNVPSIVVDDAPSADDAKLEVDKAEPAEPVETPEEKAEETEPIPPTTDDEKSASEGDKETPIEPVVEEKPVDEKPIEGEEKPVEPTEPEESIEDIKARIEEEKAIVAEEKSIVEFERQARVDEDQLARFEAAVCDSLVKSLKDIGADVNKSIDEIYKEDPEKARRVQQVIFEAQVAHQAFVEKQTAAAKERLQNIVFTRASRLLEKFGLNENEAPIVAETFVNIINEAGLKNLDSDLVAKVELAVGRAKLLAPKVVKAVEQVKGIAKDVKDTVAEVLAPAPEVTADEIVAAAEVIVEQERKEPEPKADLSEFKEGVHNASVAAGRTGKSLLDEMASITNPRERVAFYKENFKAIEEALREQANK